MRSLVPPKFGSQPLVLFTELFVFLLKRNQTLKEFFLCRF